MKLIFGGQSHSIDANTLVNILIHYQSIVNEANNVYGSGTRKVNINIKAIEKGSFVIDLELVQNVVEQLFSKDSMSYLANLAGVVWFSYEVYKEFKGRPIRSEDEKKKAKEIAEKVGSVDADTVTTVYNSKVLREAISKTMETASEDPNVEGLSVIDESNKVRVDFSREDFRDCIYDDFDNEVEMPSERCIDEDAVLTITSLSFVRKSRWSFIYNGFKIFITVNDDALMERIDNGDRFGKGDAIKVKLRILQRYNKEYKCYENKSYKIIEFYDHISPDKPKGLFE